MTRGVWASATGAVLFLIWLVPSALLAEPAIGEDPVLNVRVTEVLTATSDVHDLLVVGDRVLVATSGGLVLRRGGRVVQIMTSLDGLPGTRARALSPIAGRTAVWVATIEGVARVAWEGESDAVVERTVDLRRVRRVVRFGGATWFATWSTGLQRLSDGEGESPESVRIGRSGTYRQLTDLAVASGELLVGTSGAGVVRVAPDGTVLGRWRVRHGLAHDVVWRIVPEGGRIFVATAGGLSVIRDGAVVRDAPETAAVARLPIRDTRALAVLNDSLWIATWGGGSWRLVGAEVSRPFHPRSVGGARGRAATRRSRALAVAEGGVIVGHNSGLHYVDEDGSGLRALATGGLPTADITALERAFGAIWIGTYGQGLARLARGRAGAAEHAQRRWGVDRRINDLAVTGRGTPSQRLWIATDRGLWWYDGRRFVEVIDPEGPGRQHTTSLHVQPGTGALWVAASRQLSRRNVDGQWQSWSGDRSLPIVNLHAITSDSSGCIWVGGLHGLFRFEVATGRFTRHAVSSGDLPVDWVTALVPWGRGFVAGTYHGGLSWFDGQRFHVEREEPRGGLPSGWVNPHAMARHGGMLWIGTLERGLLVGQRGQWRQVRLADGLPSDDVTEILADGERAAWVATRGGLARVSW